MKGIALLYLRLATLFPTEKDNYKSKAKSLIDSSLEKLKGNKFIFCSFYLIVKYDIGKRISFLAGDPGPLAIAAVIYNDLGDRKTVNKCIDE